MLTDKSNRAACARRFGVPEGRGGRAILASAAVMRRNAYHRGMAALSKYGSGNKKRRPTMA